MITRRRATAAATLAALGLGVVGAGCGSSSSKDSTGASSSPAKSSGASGASTTSGAIPSALIGSYTTRLKRGDLPANPAPELTDGGLAWKLTIARTGGPNNGPAFTISSPKHGVLESSAFDVKGGHIVLHREECAAGGSEHFYDNQYGYTLAGGALRFETVKNACPDRVAQTILASEPWKRATP